MCNGKNEDFYARLVDKGIINIDTILQEQYPEWDTFAPEVQGALRKFTKKITIQALEKASDEIENTPYSTSLIGRESFRMELPARGFDYDGEGRLYIFPRFGRPPMVASSYLSVKVPFDERTKNTRNSASEETALIQKTDDEEAS